MSINSFSSSGRMVLQMGEQLIKNEVIAIIELLKNAYDADASKCELEFLENSENKITEIEIKDNGSGMTKKIIEESWLVIGSDYKKKKITNLEKSEKFNRLPIGEKGIGRFGLSKLGWNVEVITKHADDKEYLLKIDWSDFLNSESLNKVEVKIEESHLKIFRENQTGTRLRISKLKADWNRRNIRELFRQVLSLQSPFKKNGSFRIPFRVPATKSDWLMGVPTIQQISKLALFRASFRIKDNIIEELKYNFNPYEKMDRLEAKEIIKNNIPLQLKGKNDVEELDLRECDGLSEIYGEILIYDKSTNILKKFVENYGALTKFLKVNGGIRVFRDGNRIYNYGEEGDDWLKLDRNRINAPSTSLGNDSIIGLIDLKREKSLGLEEKTNREGFIESDTYKIFREAILIALKEIERFRNEDKVLLKEIYDKKSLREPVIGELDNIVTQIKKLPISEGKKASLEKQITKVKKEFEMTSMLMLKSSANGLSLSIVIHELQKRVSELKERVTSNLEVDDGIRNLSINLNKIINNYSDIIRADKGKKHDLSTLIKKSLDNVEYRLKLHEFEIIHEYLSKIGIEVSAKESLVIGSLINIIDNSIYWLDKVFKIENRKILIDIVEYNGSFGILMADNGKGFTIPTSLAIKPMLTGKDESGIGLGLFIVDECMKQQNGFLDFPTSLDLKEEKINIPDNFVNGAKIFLGFRR